MKKIIKNVIKSKLFLITIVISIFTLMFYNIWYQKNSIKEEHYYNIEYCENIDDYDIKISQLQVMIDNLDYKDINYENNKKYLEEMILIYKELKDTNIDYTYVYDFGYGMDENSITYMINSESIFIIILIINIIVIIYLCFSCEFDNNSYIFIYSKFRFKKIFTKVFTILLLFIYMFIFYSILNRLLSFVFDNNYNYILIMNKNNCKFINCNLYYIKFIHHEFYIGLFLLFLFMSICIILKET